MVGGRGQGRYCYDNIDALSVLRLLADPIMIITPSPPPVALPVGRLYVSVLLYTVPAGRYILGDDR